MQVTRLGTKDLDLALRAIRTLKMPLSQSALSDEYLKKFLSRPENILIVAAQEGVPIGFLLAYLLDRSIQIGMTLDCGGGERSQGKVAQGVVVI